MSDFSFIFHDCSGTSIDVGGGRTVVDLPAARDAAIEIARSILAKEVIEGRLCLSCWIVVKNGTGHTVLTMQFGEAVQQMDHPCPVHAPGDGPSAQS